MMVNSDGYTMVMVNNDDQQTNNDGYNDGFMAEWLAWWLIVDYNRGDISQRFWLTYVV